MLAAPLATSKLRVLVAAPFGRGGRGGIDRIMEALDTAVRAGGEPAEMTIVATRGGGSLARAPLYLANFILTLIAHALTARVDVVHINVAQKGSVVRKALIARTCYALGVPYVVHVHGSSFHRYWDSTEGGARRRIVRLFNQASRIVVLGTFWRDFLAARVEAHADRLVIVPNASLHPLVRPPRREGPVQILFLGRIGERKGTPQLVEALASLADVPGWTATIAGDGAVEQTYADAAERGIANRVNLPGWVNSEEVARLLANSDVLVLPSFDENLPMSVIEGMAQGLAIVTTPVGAVKDIVEDGETGLLIEPGDSAGLAEAISRLIGEPDLRERLGAAARRFHAVNLDLAVYAHRMTLVWQDAAARRAE